MLDCQTREVCQVTNMLSLKQAKDFLLVTRLSLNWTFIVSSIQGLILDSAA